MKNQRQLRPSFVLVSAVAVGAATFAVGCFETESDSDSNTGSDAGACPPPEDARPYGCSSVCDPATGAWSRLCVNPPAPACPAVTPKVDEPCESGLVFLACSYQPEASPCVSEFKCDATTLKWKDLSPTCNPPPVDSGADSAPSDDSGIDGGT